MSIIDQVLEKAREHVVAYLSDLDVDRSMLTEAHAPFLHFSRPYGSYLTMMLPSDHPSFPPNGIRVPYLFGKADREGLLRGLKNSNDYYCDYDGDRPRSVLIQYYDGKYVRPVTREKARSIVDEYVRLVLHQWAHRMRQG